MVKNVKIIKNPYLHSRDSNFKNDIIRFACRKASNRMILWNE